MSAIKLSIDLFLSIVYNKTRQTAITQEIIEVVSGANSQLG